MLTSLRFVLNFIEICSFKWSCEDNFIAPNSLPRDHADNMNRVKTLEEFGGHKVKTYNVWKVHQSEEKEEKGQSLQMVIL